MLLGATKLHQLDDNLAAGDLVLTAEEAATLDAMTTLAPVYPNWFTDSLVDQKQREALS